MRTAINVDISDMYTYFLYSTLKNEEKIFFPRFCYRGIADAGHADWIFHLVREIELLCRGKV